MAEISIHDLAEKNLESGDVLVMCPVEIVKHYGLKDIPKISDDNVVIIKDRNGIDWKVSIAELIRYVRES